MRTLLDLFCELWRGLTREHTHCRCCGTQIAGGGVGFFPLGSGFFHGCAAKILRRD